MLVPGSRRTDVIDVSILLQIVWTGLAASTYAILFSVAFSLVLKVVKIWNFAQAGLMAVAFYGMYAAHNWLHWPLWSSVLFGLAVTISASQFMDIYGLQVLRARKSPSLTFFIFTLVVSEFLAYLLAMIFGTEPLSLTQSIMSPVEIVHGIVISHWDMKALAITAVLLLLLSIFIGRTRQGQFMAAVADNAELSKLYGISVKQAYFMTFLITAILITAGMYLFGTRASMIPSTPLEMMLFAVISTLLGGMGRIYGAAWAAVALSLIQSLSIIVIPSQWQGVILYVFLFVTILFFPQGVKFKKFKLWARG
ncbi:branched-chain amino acid transport system permease protein [Paralcaligenes ureilyticus]|uniref:Branched-chain amino acid transport system permease protein n=1 Tax=Paralcaligenes ureilyticus TaxID=627131 RepID=A0A4R3LTY8_9BURK|nr:branched-chain amino acid transport system permease protein [Paralcaligenes ureilyticus]